VKGERNEGKNIPRTILALDRLPYKFDVWLGGDGRVEVEGGGVLS
jgi:hypothetical protein